MNQHDHHEEHDDDKPVGRVLSRREVLALLGGAGATLFTGIGFADFSQITQTPVPTPTPLPTCIVRPELTEGPFFVDTQLNRTDVRVDPGDGSVKAGTPLKLIYRVSDVSANACTPIEGAQVDIWHCDAQGEYSGVNAGSAEARESMWLRGYQLTDALGLAEFTTIYPGWYPGRAVHIHFKIRTEPEAQRGYEFVSQVFFDEDLTDVVYAEDAAYARNGYRNVLNENDFIFRGSDGMLTLNVEKLEGEDEEGYVALFDIGLDLSSV